MVSIASQSAFADTGSDRIYGPYGYWKPYVETDGYIWEKSDASVHARLWSPLVQHTDWIFHGTLGGGFFESGGRYGSAGLGYRRRFDDVIFGLYGFVDAHVTSNENYFWTIAPGIELLALNYEARLNAYFPLGDDEELLSGTVEIGTGGAMIGTALVEVNRIGVDGELGIRLPIEPGDEDQHDFWLYGGASYFEHDFTDDNLGIHGRFEWRINEIIDDYPGSRLTLMALGSWDDREGFELGGGLRARIPLGKRARCFDRNPRTIDCPSRLARRMDARIERRSGSGVLSAAVDELLVDPETDVLMRTVVTVNDPSATLGLNTSTPTGLPRTGSPADYTDIGDPTAASNLTDAADDTDEVLVVVNGGPIGSTPIAYDGQAFVDSNTTVLGTGTTIPLVGQTTGTIYNYSVAGERPLFDFDGNGAVIDIDGTGIHVAGLGVSGDETSGLTDNHGFLIQSNAQNVAIEQNVISDLAGSGVLSDGPSDDVRVFDNDDIFDIAGDGIDFGSQNINTQIYGNTIRDVEGSGVSFLNQNQFTSIRNNIIQDTGADGIFIDDNNADINIIGNEITNVAEAGIEFTDDSSRILIDGNTIDGTVNEGIRLDAMSTDTTIQNNEIRDTGDVGILMSSDHTNVTIFNNELNGTDLSGISLAGRNNNVSITFNHIEDAGRTDPAQSMVGIRLADQNGTTSANNSVSDNTIIGVRSSGSAGVDVGILFQNENQNFQVDRNTILGVNETGISFGEETVGFTISGNEIDGRDHGTGTAVATVLTVDGIRLDGSENRDIVIGSLTGTAISNRISNVADSGIVSWNGTGATVNSDLVIRRNEITRAEGAGIYFRRNTDDSEILLNEISNSGIGIRIGGRNDAGAGPGVGNDNNQIAGNTISDSGSAGIAVEYYNTGGTAIENNTIDGVAGTTASNGDGIQVLEGNLAVDISGNTFLNNFNDDILQIGVSGASNNFVSSTTDNDDLGATSSSVCNVNGVAGGSTIFLSGITCN